MQNKGKTWCPGWDLNPHSRCRKRDFKSLQYISILLQVQELLPHEVEMCKRLCNFSQ